MSAKSNEPKHTKVLDYKLEYQMGDIVREYYDIPKVNEVI